MNKRRSTTNSNNPLGGQTKRQNETTAKNQTKIEKKEQPRKTLTILSEANKQSGCVYIETDFPTF